jgi:hypothetical protein
MSGFDFEAWEGKRLTREGPSMAARSVRGEPATGVGTSCCWLGWWSHAAPSHDGGERGGVRAPIPWSEVAVDGGDHGEGGRSLVQCSGEDLHHDSLASVLQQSLWWTGGGQDQLHTLLGRRSGSGGGTAARHSSASVMRSRGGDTARWNGEGKGEGNFALCWRV